MFHTVCCVCVTDREREREPDTKTRTRVKDLQVFIISSFAIVTTTAFRRLLRLGSTALRCHVRQVAAVTPFAGPLIVSLLRCQNDGGGRGLVGVGNGNNEENKKSRRRESTHAHPQQQVITTKATTTNGRSEHKHTAHNGQVTWSEAYIANRRRRNIHSLSCTHTHTYSNTRGPCNSR